MYIPHTVNICLIKFPHPLSLLIPFLQVFWILLYPCEKFCLRKRVRGTNITVNWALISIYVCAPYNSCLIWMKQSLNCLKKWTGWILWHPFSLVIIHSVRNIDPAISITLLWHPIEVGLLTSASSNCYAIGLCLEELGCVELSTKESEDKGDDFM